MVNSFPAVSLADFFVVRDKTKYVKPILEMLDKNFAIHSVTFMASLNLPFSENHSNKIQNFMLDVMCPIILEGDSVPQELLDTVLVNIIEPQKVL